MNSFVFNTTQSIINEAGSLQKIANICREHNISKPIIVSDQGIIGIGLLEKLTGPLSEGNITFDTFEDVIAEPTEALIYEALDTLKTNGNDSVIGFGGGSSMDVAKLVSLMANTGAKLDQIYGVDVAQGERLPLILIPTTAGTGSEVTAAAIVKTSNTSKAGVVANQLYPDVALLDGELTLELPRHITATTGIDAMVHAIEAYTNKHLSNEQTDELSKEALKLLSNNILMAAHQGDDIQARQNMLMGACLAGQAFANSSLAAVHALAYPLYVHYHIPHGLSNALILPHVMRFNAPMAAERYAELAPIIMNVETVEGDVETVTETLINYIEELIVQLKLPNALHAMEIPQVDLPMLATDGLKLQQLLVNNPREVTEEDALSIYEAAY